jgi:hypothetical protein
MQSPANRSPPENPYREKYKARSSTQDFSCGIPPRSPPNRSSVRLAHASANLLELLSQCFRTTLVDSALSHLIYDGVFSVSALALEPASVLALALELTSVSALALEPVLASASALGPASVSALALELTSVSALALGPASASALGPASASALGPASVSALETASVSV